MSIDEPQGDVQCLDALLRNQVAFPTRLVAVYSPGVCVCIKQKQSLIKYFFLILLTALYFGSPPFSQDSWHLSFPQRNLIRCLFTSVFKSFLASHFQRDVWHFTVFLYKDSLVQSSASWTADFVSLWRLSTWGLFAQKYHLSSIKVIIKSCKRR